MIKDTRYKGAKYVVRIPNKKSDDGFINEAFCDTEREGEGRILILTRNKGRRAMQGAHVTLLSTLDSGA